MGANQANQRSMMIMNQPGPGGPVGQTAIQYDQSTYSMGNGPTGGGPTVMNTGGPPQRQASLNDSYSSMGPCIGMPQQSGVPSAGSQVISSHMQGSTQQPSGGIGQSLPQMQSQRGPTGFVSMPPASVPNQVI